MFLNERQGEISPSRVRHYLGGFPGAPPKEVKFSPLGARKIWDPQLYKMFEQVGTLLPSLGPSFWGSGDNGRARSLGKPLGPGGPLIGEKVSRTREGFNTWGTKRQRWPGVNIPGTERGSAPIYSPGEGPCGGHTHVVAQSHKGPRRIEKISPGGEKPPDTVWRGVS